MEFLGKCGSHLRKSVRWGGNYIKEYPAVSDHPNRVNLWRLSKSVWGTTPIAWIYGSFTQVHGTKSCERWTVYFAKWNDVSIVPLAQSFSVILVSLYVSDIPVSPCAPHQLPPVKMNGGGAENQTFLRQRPSSMSLCSPNHSRQVLFRLRSSTICRLIDRMYIYSHLDRESMPHYNVPNLLTVTKMNMIDRMPCSYGTLRTTTVRIWYQVSHRGCTGESATLEVSRTPALWSQLLLKSPAHLRQGLSICKIGLT